MHKSMNAQSNVSFPYESVLYLRSKVQKVGLRVIKQLRLSIFKRSYLYMLTRLTWFVKHDCEIHLYSFLYLIFVQQCWLLNVFGWSFENQRQSNTPFSRRWCATALHLCWIMLYYHESASFYNTQRWNTSINHARRIQFSQVPTFLSCVNEGE